MGRTEIYKCDRCGGESTVTSYTRKVLIAVGSRDYPDFFRDADWCDWCINEAGLVIPPKPKKEDPLPPLPPTLEDMIREIVRSEIQQ